MDKLMLIFAAFLAVTTTVAGHGHSVHVKRQQLRNDGYSKNLGYYLLARPHVHRRLLGHPMERSLIYGESIRVPGYLQDDIYDFPVLQFTDVVTHPLFGVYMRLPFFQQYWSYPMFQRYVCSQYFQRFWQVPAFQNYFTSPVLFYKYIYPLVMIFNYDPTATTYGYPASTYYPLTIGQLQKNPNNFLINDHSERQVPKNVELSSEEGAVEENNLMENDLDAGTRDAQVTNNEENMIVDSTAGPVDESSSSSSSSESSSSEEEFNNGYKAKNSHKNRFNSPPSYLNPLFDLLHGY